MCDYDKITNVCIFAPQEITLWRKGEKLHRNSSQVHHGPSHLVAMEGGPKGSEPPRFDPVSTPSEENRPDEDDAISPTNDD